jgi:O-antigen/teichoic acid export membrane protein
VAVIGGFTLMAVLVVGLIVGSLTVGAGLFRLAGCVRLKRPSRPKVVLAATSAGILLLLVDLASFLVGRGDVWLSASTFAPAEAVRYSTASLLAFQITVPMGLANVALTPIAARMWKERARDDLRNTMDSVAAVAMTLTAAAVVVIWTTGPFAVGLVYGQELRSAWLPLAILATGTLVFSAWGGSSILLIVSGHGRQAAITGLAALALVVPLAVAAAEFGGSTPLAVASSAATCCLVGSQRWCCRRYVGYAPSPLRGLARRRARNHSEPQAVPEPAAAR